MNRGALLHVLMTNLTGSEGGAYCRLLYTTCFHDVLQHMLQHRWHDQSKSVITVMRGIGQMGEREKKKKEKVNKHKDAQFQFLNL